MLLHPVEVNSLTRRPLVRKEDMDDSEEERVVGSGTGARD
jgi:hypothetical protein